MSIGFCKKVEKIFEKFSEGQSGENHCGEYMPPQAKTDPREIPEEDEKEKITCDFSLAL